VLSRASVLAVLFSCAALVACSAPPDSGSSGSGPSPSIPQGGGTEENNGGPTTEPDGGAPQDGAATTTPDAARDAAPGQDSGVPTIDAGPVDAGPQPQDSGPGFDADPGFDAAPWDAGPPPDSGPAPECTSLDACCQKLGSSMYPGCESIVSSNYALSCANALQSYLSNGYCTGGTHCADLSSCCPQLPSAWQSTCTYYVDLNNDPQCQSLFGQYQTDGYCGGGPQGACTSLDACCRSMDPSYFQTCEYYVTAGSQTDCDTIHNNYRTAKLCN
jgi:hypothetical protein